MFKNFKFAVISETVRRQSEMERLSEPYRITACKITNFEIFDLLVSDCLINIFHYFTCKEQEFQLFQIYLIKYILETLLLKFSVFKSHDPQGHMTWKIQICRHLRNRKRLNFDPCRVTACKFNKKFKFLIDVT